MKYVSWIFKFLKSKVFHFILLILVLAILSILFWLYAPMLSFNDRYLFTTNLPKVILLCLVWSPFVIFFSFKHIKRFFSETFIQKRKENNSLKAEASNFFLRTKRNFFISLNDAKNTWKKSIKFRKLPLVMVLGREGAGKSSFINYSGLEFPISDALGSYKQHHLSTKNFTFYIAKNGVLIDTEGSYFSFEKFFHPTNTDEIPEDDLNKNKDYLLRKMVWGYFIKFLSKGKFYKKLNGIVYTLDIQKMLNSSLEEIEEEIGFLSKRIRECESHLNLKIPIYVVFTKLDLIEGMGEFLKLHSENLHKKTLGVTFSTNFSFSPEGIHQSFLELSDSIKCALMGKNNLNPTLQSKAQSYLFLKQFDNLLAFIETFLQRMYQANEKNKSFIRGVYFVSSYQENTPNNFILNSVCHKYDIKAPIAQNKSTLPKQSYFVRSLLEDVIFKDIGLSQSILGSLWRKISTSLIGIFTIGITIYLTNYLIEQKNLQEKNLNNSIIQIENAIDTLQVQYPKASIQKKSFYVQNLKNILAFYPQIFAGESLMDYPTLNLAYQAFIPAKELFLEKSENILMLTLIPELESLLLNIQNPENFLKTFYLYKTLVQRRYLQKELIIDWVRKHWDSFQKYGISQEVFEGYIQELSSTPYWNIKENKQVITKARTQLIKVARPQRLYTLLSLRSNDSQEIYNLRAEVGGAFDEVFDISINPYLIPSSYTKNGAISLMANINKHIDETIQVESWLLGDQGQALDDINNNKEKIALSMDIIKLYAQEYTQKWQTLLSKVRPKPFANESSGLGILGILGKANNPMKGFIQVVSRNTQLLEGNDIINQAINIGLPAIEFKSIFEALSDNFSHYHTIAKEDSLIAQGLSVVSAKTTDQEDKLNEMGNFAPSIPKNTQTIKKISADVNAIYQKIINFGAGNLSSQEKIFYALKKPSSPDDPFVILKTDSQTLPTEIDQYYQQLGSYAWGIIEKRGTKELDIVWSQELYTPFIDQIASTYPINPRSKEMLKINAFKEFFGKQGVWDKFYSQYLSQILIKRGDVYQVDPAYAKKLNFSSEFLNALTKISTISNEILDFNNNIDLKFGIRVVALSGDYGKLEISYNDKTIEYDHTLPVNLEFVADLFSEDTKITISSFDYNGNKKQNLEFSGQWAYLQFMQYAQTTNNGYKITFDENPNSYFNFKVISGNNMLKKALEILPYLELPQNILSGHEEK